MKIHAFYFSATGNTEKALRTAERELEAAGHKVAETLVTANCAVPDISSCDCVIAAFPVLAKAPPVMFSRFLRKLPRGDKAGDGRVKAAVIAVDGGGGGYAGNRAAGILKKRGYDIVSIAQTYYPSNWAQMNAVSDGETAEKALAIGEKAAKEFGIRLARGESSKYTLRAKKDFMDIIMPPLFGSVGRRFLGKLFYADRDCDSCGLCARTCPAGTILLGKGKGKRPFWKSNCENCNRCINVCPKGAIVSSLGRIVFMIAAIIASSWAGIWAYRKFAYPLIAGSMPISLAAAVDVFAISAIIFASHIVAIWPFDYLVLRWLQRIPLLNRCFAWSYTKGKRKYLAKGFKPAPVKRTGNR